MKILLYMVYNYLNKKKHIHINISHQLSEIYQLEKTFPMNNCTIERYNTDDIVPHNLISNIAILAMFYIYFVCSLGPAEVVI